MCSFITRIIELAVRVGCNNLITNVISYAQARVWQPIPATVPSLPNTCFFATAHDSLILPNMTDSIFYMDLGHPTEL